VFTESIVRPQQQGCRDRWKQEGVWNQSKFAELGHDVARQVRHHQGRFISRDPLIAPAAALMKRLVGPLPRHMCVLAGSINPRVDIVKDATGRRRFWPVACDAITLPLLTRPRDQQLWAEACVRFRWGRSFGALDNDNLESLQQSSRRRVSAVGRVGRTIPPAISNTITEQKRRNCDRRGDFLQKATGHWKGRRWTQADQNGSVATAHQLGFAATAAA